MADLGCKAAIRPGGKAANGQRIVSLAFAFGNVLAEIQLILNELGGRRADGAHRDEKGRPTT